MYSKYTPLAKNTIFQQLLIPLYLFQHWASEENLISSVEKGNYLENNKV